MINNGIPTYYTYTRKQMKMEERESEREYLLEMRGRGKEKCIINHRIILNRAEKTEEREEKL